MNRLDPQMLNPVEKSFNWRSDMARDVSDYKQVPPRCPNCNLSNLVQMGGQKQHYGEIVNGHCTTCGQAEFAPGFIRPALLRRIRESQGWRRDALIYIPNVIVGTVAWSLLGWWAVPLLLIWSVVFARVLHGEWIWEWW